MSKVGLEGVSGGGMHFVDGGCSMEELMVFGGEEGLEFGGIGLDLRTNLLLEVTEIGYAVGAEEFGDVV